MFWQAHTNSQWAESGESQFQGSLWLAGTLVRLLCSQPFYEKKIRHMALCTGL